jgi:hypothetical protein
MRCCVSIYLYFFVRVKHVKRAPAAVVPSRIEIPALLSGEREQLLYVSISYVCACVWIVVHMCVCVCVRWPAERRGKSW